MALSLKGVNVMKTIIICILLSLGTSNKEKKAHWFDHWGKEYPHIPVEMIIAVGWHESKMRHITTPNKTNDVGIMQINIPSWEGQCKGRCDLTKLKYNIQFGYKVLDYGRKYKGGPLKGYNPLSRGYEKKVTRIMKEIRKTKQICKEHYETRYIK